MPNAKEKTAAARYVDKPIGAPHGTSKPKSSDAIALLKQDHREVEGYFEAFEKSEGKKKKAALAAQICRALTIHAQIEEEIFYPAARDATGNNDLLDEATVEHAAAKRLIAEIETMSVDDELFDAKVKVLGEQIEHHVEEEEKELFPETQKTDLDLSALGEQLVARKAELAAEIKE
jgi:hemerythrin superfamily protein